MKKVIMLAAVVAALASCQSKANKTVEAQADSIAITMTPTTRLTDNADTVYTLDMTYLDAEGQGQNKTFTSKGKQETVQKVVNNKPMTAVKLSPKNGEAPMYFVIVNDTTLRLVNDSLQEAVSNLNYDIIKVK